MGRAFSFWKCTYLCFCSCHRSTNFGRRNLDIEPLDNLSVEPSMGVAGMDLRSHFRSGLCPEKFSCAQRRDFLACTWRTVAFRDIRCISPNGYSAAGSGSTQACGQWHF